MLSKRYLALPLASAALIAAGCGSDDDGGNASKSAVPAKPAGGESHMTVDTGASVSVASPPAGKVVTGDAVPFDVRLSNFKVDCRFAGTAHRDGVGHYHVELDGALIDMFCSDRDQVSLQNVAPGKHTLQFIPADNQHTDDLKAEKKVSFTYQPANPCRRSPARRRVRPRSGSSRPSPAARFVATSI